MIEVSWCIRKVVTKQQILLMVLHIDPVGSEIVLPGSDHIAGAAKVSQRHMRSDGLRSEEECILLTVGFTAVKMVLA